MAYIREGLNAHVQDYIDSQVQSSFTLFNPIFYFLGLSSPDGKNDLGRPDTSSVFGGVDMTTAQKEEILGSKDHQFRFVKAEPNDGEAIEYGGTTPSAAAFAEDNFGTAETRWTHFMEPMKIRGHSMNFARGDMAIRRVVDDSTAPVWERFVKRVNQAFWTGTRTQAQQNATVWQDLLGIQHTLTDGNFYGRVDRSVETNLDGTYINAATQLPTTAIDLDITRKINVGFTDELGVDITGLAGRSKNGVGAMCIITTSALWQELASQAEGRYQIFENGIPDTAIAGFKFPVIKKDNAYITWDPYCPSLELYALNLDTWVVELQRGYNFTWSGFTRKDRSEEGGAYYEWGNFEAMIRFTCRAPWLNARVDNLTTS